MDARRRNTSGVSTRARQHHIHTLHAFGLQVAGALPLGAESRDPKPRILRLRQRLGRVLWHGQNGTSTCLAAPVLLQPRSRAGLVWNVGAFSYRGRSHPSVKMGCTPPPEATGRPRLCSGAGRHALGPLQKPGGLGLVWRSRRRPPSLLSRLGAHLALQLTSHAHHTLGTAWGKVSSSK